MMSSYRRLTLEASFYCALRDQLRDLAADCLSKTLKFVDFKARHHSVVCMAIIREIAHSCTSRDPPTTPCSLLALTKMPHGG